MNGLENEKLQTLFESAGSFELSLEKTNVHDFSKYVLGCEYTQLVRIIYPKPQYTVFTLLKKSGGTRRIKDPTLKLKEIQRKLLSYLYSITPKYKPCAHAFIKKKSIVPACHAVSVRSCLS